MAIPRPRIAGVLLAAGASSRFGRPKPLLEWGSKNFVQWHAISFATAGISPLVITVRSELGAKWREDWAPGARLVINDETGKGQFHSLRLAMTALSDPFDGYLLQLVDSPFTLVSTYEQILESACANPSRIFVPEHEGRAGHPIFLPGWMREVILTDENLNPPEGLKTLLQIHSESLEKVKVDDAGICEDVDTKDDYQAALERYAQRLQERERMIGL